MASGISSSYNGIQTKASFLIIVGLIAYFFSNISSEFACLEVLILTKEQSFFKFNQIELILKISVS